MYYGHEVKEMLEVERRKAREAALARLNKKKYDENGEEIPQDDEEAPEVLPPPPAEPTVKHSIHSGPYAICRKANIGEISNEDLRMRSRVGRERHPT